jgi:Fe-S-cluster containining protein
LGVIPCGAGCSACCHGPFDISAADARLLAAGVERLPPEARPEVARRAAALVERVRALEPGFGPPWDVDAIPEERFDAICEALAGEPCPLLDAEGRCRVYADRPLICRMIGLPMATPAGRTLANECPIRERFPVYARLAPQPFPLEDLEDVEIELCREARSEDAALPGTTFIAGLVDRLLGDDAAGGAAERGVKRRGALLDPGVDQDSGQGPAPEPGGCCT